VPSDDWEAASMAVTNGSLKISMQMIRSLDNFFVIFFFFWVLFVKGPV
jgi:hypothetical protein